MLSEVIFALVLIALYYNYRKNQRRRDVVKNLNGPYCIPNVGAIHLFLQVDIKNFINMGQQLYDKYGSCVPVWMFNRLIVLSSDLEINEQVLSKTQFTVVKHPIYKVLGQWLGNGLLTSEGHTWHQRRKIITPTFHFKVLEQFVEVFDQHSTICLEHLATKADGRTPFDVYPYICKAALDIIAETAMGTKINSQSNKSTEYVQAVTELTALLSWRFLSVMWHVEWIFTLFRPLLKLRQMKLIRTMHEFTIKIIEDRRSQLAAAQSAKDVQVQRHDDELEDLGAKKRMALLDVLLQATVDGKPLANDEIREEVDTFMFEGHDTTTSAVCHSLYLLARHAQIQTKLREEVLRELGADQTRPVTLRDLNELKYMECVIKETLRIYPSVPVVARKVVQDFKYTHTKFGEGILPAGTELLISFIGAMRSPLNFEQPLSFIPERHESGETSGAFALIPFSAGPRNCIGQKFAVLELKMILAKIVRNFELLPLGETLKSELNIVLRSSNGFQLGLRKI